MGLFGKRKKEKEIAASVSTEPITAMQDSDAEVAAAIAVALRLYSYKSMEFEETIITIQKVIRPYSPWNSKIYNMKQMPPRIHHRRMK
mgnify:CR=1 FL=1